MYCNLIGQQFAAGREVAAMLPADAKVYLIREPSNQYDPNAIQIWADKDLFPGVEIQESAIKGSFIRLGFVCREQAAELAPEMDRREIAGMPATHHMEGLIETNCPPFRLAKIIDGEIGEPEEGKFETRSEAQAECDARTDATQAWAIVEPM